MPRLVTPSRIVALRSLSLGKAREIADAVRGQVRTVGVFVNTPTRSSG